MILAIILGVLSCGQVGEDYNSELYWNTKDPTYVIMRGRREDDADGARNYVDVRWYFCNKYCAEIQEIVKPWEDMSTDDKMLSAQNGVRDNIGYTKDIDQYGQTDYWADALETLRSRQGDCDDGAWRLRVAGRPTRAARCGGGRIYNGAISNSSVA